MLNPKIRHHEFEAVISRGTAASEIWLHELMQEFPLFPAKQVYSIFQAVLHALRDRLSPEHAAHFAAQLPTLIRGMYFEGWRPTDKPLKEKTMGEFLEEVAHHWNLEADAEVEAITRSVFQFLKKKISAGEIEKIKSTLPKDIRQLWE